MKGGFDYGEERRRRMTREEELDWLCRLKSEICTCMPKNWKNMSTALDMAIKALEQEHFTVDSKPIVHAHWTDCAITGIKCSNCNFPLWVDDKTIHKLAYCPHCGAKMDE